MKLKLKIIFSFIAFALIFSAVAIEAESNYRLPKPLSATYKYLPGEIIVKYKNGASLKSINSANFSAKVKKITKKHKNFQTVKLQAGTSVKSALKKLRKNKSVEYAEPNYIYQISKISPNNDTYFSRQWALENVGQLIWGSYGKDYADIRAKKAWALEDGSKRRVTVAVIDTGIDTTHPDLSANLWRNQKETANGKDDDENGYIDDINGYNWTGISNYLGEDIWNLGRYKGFTGEQIGDDEDSGGSEEEDDTSYSNLGFQTIKGTGETVKTISFKLSKTNRYMDDIDIRISKYNGSSSAFSPILNNGPTLSSTVIRPWEVGEEPTFITKKLNPPIKLEKDQYYYITLSVDRYYTYHYYNIYYNKGDLGSNGEIHDAYGEGQFNYWTGTSWNKEQMGDDGKYFAENHHDIVFGLNSDADPYEGNKYLTQGIYGLGNPRDNNGHGTHVSGIIAADDNNIGVVGVNPNARIMSLKVGDSNGIMTNKNIANAIYYAISKKAKVINMSFGGMADSATVRRAIEAANRAGIVLVAAVGNAGDANLSSGNSSSFILNAINYPAAYNKVIGVAATNNIDETPSFSTFNSTVDLSAPGRAVYSTFPTYTVGANSVGWDYNYDFSDGTSMSAAHVSGLASLLLAKRPNLTPIQVEKLMEFSASDFGDAGRDDYFGFGKINMHQTLRSLRVAPKRPIAPLLSSSTHPSSAKLYNKDNKVTFDWSSSARFGIKGYSYVLNQSPNTIPDNKIDTETNSKTYKNIGSGRWYFHIKSAEGFGIWSQTSHMLVKIDSYKPKTSALNSVDVLYGQHAALNYRIDDPYSIDNKDGVSKVKAAIVITLNGNAVKLFNLGKVSTGVTHSYDYLVDLPKGNYKYNVYATDLAGNNQLNIASNDITVDFSTVK